MSNIHHLLAARWLTDTFFSVGATALRRRCADAVIQVQHSCIAVQQDLVLSATNLISKDEDELEFEMRQMQGGIRPTCVAMQPCPWSEVHSKRGFEVQPTI